jgi:hypothetical protein
VCSDYSLLTIEKTWLLRQKMRRSPLARGFTCGWSFVDQIKT